MKGWLTKALIRRAQVYKSTAGRAAGSVKGGVRYLMNNPGKVDTEEGMKIKKQISMYKDQMRIHDKKALNIKKGLKRRGFD